MKKQIILTLFILATVTACATMDSASTETKSVDQCDSGQIMRAAFDIGSSGPSIRVACVVTTSAEHLNRFKIVRVIKLPKGKDERKIDFSQVLPNWQPPANCKSAVFDQFAELISVTKSYKPAETRAAATAAFRNSPRGTAFIDGLNRCFPTMNARKVSQQFEGELEYRAVADKKGLLLNQVSTVPMVWGIGSTSVQFTFLELSGPNGTPKFTVGDGNGGGKVFYETIEKSRIIVAGAQAAVYPISAKERIDLSAQKKDLVTNRIPPKLLNSIANKTVVGVGNSHKYLFVPKTKVNKGDGYSGSSVSPRLDKLIGKNESDIKTAMQGIDAGPRYHAHTVSTLILVEGFLAGLGVKEVETVGADVADGVLVYEKW